MRELGKSAPGGAAYRVFLVGGGTAVWMGWRESTIDADLHSEQEAVFHDIQGIKERLHVNIEFARPEHFVPSLKGSEDRHIFVDTFRRVSFYHYDPYAQLLSKIVRGFERDVLDAEQYIQTGLVDAGRFRGLVAEIPEEAYSRYPALSRTAVLSAVDQFLDR